MGQWKETNECIYSNQTLGKISKGTHARSTCTPSAPDPSIPSYVKVSLPEGVTQEGSEFWSLQEQFEKVLISQGLLQVKVGGDENQV